MLNRYYDERRVQERIRRHQHRALVGGFWDELGAMQLQYLQDQGLRSGMRLLDVGCGCFRAGVHAVAYLDPGNYYGIDLSLELMKAGYERELKPKGLHSRMPIKNMLASDRFEFNKFGVEFDYFLAQSLFTHLPLNHLMLCLEKAAVVSRQGARFLATFFICKERDLWAERLSNGLGVSTFPDRDPYHYHPEHITYAAQATGWRLDFLEDWNHPRGQLMAAFSRRT